MNERILELAKQCGYWSGQTIEMNDVGIEKFTQLIVRECADHIMTSSDRYRREYFADKILKHFGVEE